ncbi:uncharacterized protein [Oryza sativa Japonica Group]|uniref:uncharacterized protein n=1 Tax=Oryza sativa subsp. japonica TaxID=39947 RepID=UPI00339C468A
MSHGTIPEYGVSGIENEGIDFDLEDMLRHVELEVLTGTRRGLDNWEALEKTAKELLYDEAKGCDKDYSVLRSVLELLRLKARHGWLDTSFNDLMDLLRVNTYQAKKLICPLSLGVQKIHACENYCILYRKEFADLNSCPTCGTSRCKTGNGASDGEVVDKDDAPLDENKKIPRMVMWYLRVKDRLKRLYSNRDDAKLMRWHQEGRKNDVENDLAPETRTGGSVFEMTKNIKVVFGKPKKKPKHSIFFRYLDYWKDLEVRHAIDVMHLEKNVFDSTIGTLLDILSKTKDGFKSRTNLVNLDIRHEHHPKELPNGKIDIPPACYSLTPNENKSLCRCLHSVEVSTGFLANVGKLVSLKDLTISGYNAHDCHKMLIVFLPIAIRAVKPVHTRLVITKLCYFFNRVSQKVFDPEELGPIQKFAIKTACQLEMFFPPAYFNMMEHLIVHIVPQIIEIGPLYLHQMWAYERYMSILKGYVRNRAYPEGSMIEGYTTKEVVECCIDYMKYTIYAHLHSYNLGRSNLSPSPQISPL